MINYIKECIFGKPEKVIKRIAFLDGDQSWPALLRAKNQFLSGVECHFIKLVGVDQNESKELAKVKDLNKIYLRGYKTGKEVCDKYIAAAIQKAVSDEYTEITVISSDYDFIDIFRMVVEINTDMGVMDDVSFKLILPLHQKQDKGRVLTNNISIVKM